MTLLGLCTAILVLVAIHLAWPILAPLVFSLFVIALVWPLQLALQRRIPRLLGVVVTVLVVTVTIAVIGTLLTWGFSRAARWLIADAARFQAMYLQATEWFEGHGFAVAGLFGDVFTPGRMLSAAQKVGVWLQVILGFSAVTLVFTILGLLEVDLAAAKLRALPNVARAEALARAARDTAAKLQTYMLVRTAMSLITGALVAGFAALVGLPLAVEWGVIAFALNYIPFIGPFVATVIPDAIRHLSIRILGNAACGVCRVQRHPVRGRKLSRTADRRQRTVDFALHRAACGVSVELPVGSSLARSLAFRLSSPSSPPASSSRAAGRRPGSWPGLRRKE
ncbi:MAG: AI-2E family transporter [Rhodopseudomonas palustris]|nr:AI-2E family transporter [Rhodopseudomonas palustris]